MTTTVTSFVGEAAIPMRCWCSIQLAIPASLYDYYRRKNEQASGSFSLHCPLGHTFIPAGRSEADKLRDQLAAANERAEAQRQSKLHAWRQISARKGIITRLKNRIARGTCPCCSQTFTDLKLHMRRRHPKWDLEKAVAALTKRSAS